MWLMEIAARRQRRASAMLLRLFRRLAARYFLLFYACRCFDYADSQRVEFQRRVC